MKKTVGFLALVAALLMCGQSVLAQNYKGTPKPTIQDYGPFANSKVRTPHTVNQNATCGNPAAACLFTAVTSWTILSAPPLPTA